VLTGRNVCLTDYDKRINAAVLVIFSKILFFVLRFINARRRIVQPMIDQSNRAGKITREEKNVLILFQLIDFCIAITHKGSF
jgi:hypothetical protein